MDLSITWFSKNTATPKKQVIPLLDTKPLSMSVSMFKHGYRRFGISIQKSTIFKFYFSINFGTGQIFGTID